MTDFINFEADVEDDSDHDEEVSNNSDLDSLFRSLLLIMMN